MRDEETGTTRLNVAYLGFVVLIPFGQRVQGDYPFEPLAYAIYAGIMAFTSALDTAAHFYAHRAGLTREPWSRRRFHTEMLRSVAPFLVFLFSVPGAFILVNRTIWFWVLLLPLDKAIVRLRAEKTASQRSPTANQD